MTEPLYDVSAVGNALVDVIAHAEDDFITAEGMNKGTMQLLFDEAEALAIYGKMGPGMEVSGGSAANTMAGIASFGGRGAFIGKVADDQLGKVFAHDLKSMGIVYETQPLALGSTGRCMILVTPDAERTMNTYLGAASEVSSTDIEAARDLIASSKVTYLEGYLYDRDVTKEAFVIAAKIAHDAGHHVALTLSDPFCVDRHRADFQDLVEHHIDILFANEQEIISLYDTETFEQAFKIVRDKCEIAALTRSEKGAVVVRQHEFVEVPALQVEKIVDSTGAGDQFAAGFLYGYTHDMSMEQCARLGCMAAGEVISHIGPRPEKPYAGFLKLAA